jgi:hypothetical protein
MGEKGDAHKVLVGKTERKRNLENLGIFDGRMILKWI